MTKISKERRVNGYNVTKELKRVDALFASIAKDKNLPTFGEFVLLCIVLGTSEQVNLKAMYPKVHSKVSKWVIAQNRKITSSRKIWR